MTDTSETIAIDVPTELQAKLEQRIEGTDFESLEAYLRFVLEEIVAEDDVSSETQADETGTDADLESRLEDLGYM